MALHRDARTALGNLQVDLTTVKVSRALESAGLRSVLLKGPSIAEWLYEEPSRRQYTDTDLLVSPSDVPRALDCLRRLGFLLPLEHASRFEQDGHSVLTHPPSGSLFCEVDLHYTLPGAEAPPEVLWQTLGAHLSTQNVLSQPIMVLDEVGRALTVVLHAARNGPQDSKSTEDLVRLLAQPINWPDVASLATKVGAEPALARGLGLVSEGVAVRDSLRLTRRRNVETELREADAPALAFGFERLSNTRGTRQRLSLLGRELWPSPAFLQFWAERAQLPLTSLWRLRLVRLSYVLREGPPAAWAWAKVRRRAR